MCQPVKPQNMAAYKNTNIKNTQNSFFSVVLLNVAYVKEYYICFVRNEEKTKISMFKPTYSIDLMQSSVRMWNYETSVLKHETLMRIFIANKRKLTTHTLLQTYKHTYTQLLLGHTLKIVINS